MVNNKCQLFTDVAVGIEVWHFAYTVTYRDKLVKVKFLYASVHKMRDCDYVLKPKVEMIIVNFFRHKFQRVVQKVTI